MMEVQFSDKHIYKALDESKRDSDESSAIIGAGSDQCAFVSKNGGEYKVSFKLDKCGTQIEQVDDTIIFTNSVSGNAAALTIQGIIMTKILTFPVSCTYDDEFQLDIDPIHLNSAIVDIDGIHENGDVSYYYYFYILKKTIKISDFY